MIKGEKAKSGKYREFVEAIKKAEKDLTFFIQN